MKMKDSIVRTAFHRTILAQGFQTNDNFVIDELGLKNGQSRADIAVLNGKLIGYEIKTEQDNLKRLSSQVLAYNEVFDNVFIVTAKKHLNSVLLEVPDWWGVYLIEAIADDYVFRRIRKSKRNRMKRSLGIAQLLWKDEVIDILINCYDCKLKSNLDKHQLYNILVERSSPSKLTQFVLHYLKSRVEWRTNPKLL